MDDFMFFALFNDLKF